MKPDIKTLAFAKKFGEIETAVYADRSLIGDLVALLGEKNGDVRSGVLNLLSRVGFDYPNDTRPHLPTLIALLDDPDMFIKIDAANAVGNLGFSFKDSAAKAAPEAQGPCWTMSRAWCGRKRPMPSATSALPIPTW